MRPLEDVRIISLEQYGAGPFGSLHLADLGADVIKIEDPRVGGDSGRYVPPFAEDGESLFYETFNRNKRGVSLDITSVAGRRVFEDLARVGDVVYSNFRGDVPEKLRITYADLAHVNPAIVCCSLTGYGMTGPLRTRPAYDYMLQAISGWMTLTGEPEGPPAKSGLSLVDYTGGFVAATSILAGVHAARRDGIGSDCDLSLYDTAISMLTYLGTWHLTRGYRPERTAHSAHPSLVPFQAFEASDGWLVVGCAKEKFWQRLAVVLGVAELLDDPRFASFALRREYADQLLPVLIERFRLHTVAEWTVLLDESGIPCGPVQDIATALASEHTAARDLVVETEHPRFGTVRQLASPVRVGSARGPYRRAPRRDEHTAEVLGDLLGYDSVTVSELAAAGAFGAVENTEA